MQVFHEQFSKRFCRQTHRPNNAQNLPLRRRLVSGGAAKVGTCFWWRSRELVSCSLRMVWLGCPRDLFETLAPSCHDRPNVHDRMTGTTHPRTAQQLGHEAASLERMAAHIGHEHCHEQLLCVCHTLLFESREPLQCVVAGL